MNIENCPCCGERAQVDKSFRKTCVNIDCDENYGTTHFHHVWFDMHKEREPSISVEPETNQLMAVFQ